MNARSRIRLAGFALAALALGCVLKEPIMVLPAPLLSNADVLPVSGRQGLVFPWTPLHFGAFRTTSILRGWARVSSWSWGILDDDETFDAKQPLTFVLEGGVGEQWSAHCLARKHEHHRDVAVGFHFGTDGAGIDRRRVEAVSNELFECDLEGPARARWRLLLSDADPSGMGGVLLDDRQAVRARVSMVREQTGRPYTYAVPQPVGFLVETTVGPAVGVERAFDGKVVLSRFVPAGEATVLAAVATALLVWEPIGS